MKLRLVHTIDAECETCITPLDANTVRIRIRETNPDSLNPTDFEIEGTPEHISEVMATIAAILDNYSVLVSEKEPN